MPFYLAQVTGSLGSAFPWSCNAVLSATANESSVAATWNSAISALFGASGFNGLLPSTVALTGTSVSTASSTFHQTTKTRTANSIVGAATAAALPYHTAEIVTFRTTSATRYGRARWYLPPLAETALATTGFVLSSAAQTAIQTAMDAFFTALGGTVNVMILHRKQALNNGPAPYTTDPVTTCDIPQAFAVQRRRADKLTETRLSVTV